MIGALLPSAALSSPFSDRSVAFDRSGSVVDLSVFASIEESDVAGFFFFLAFGFVDAAFFFFFGFGLSSVLGCVASTSFSV